MRHAVIDIGTNTVKLLVADVVNGSVTPVVAMDRTTRLGEGVNATRQLGLPAIERTIATIVEYVTEARALGATEVIAFTTSAARDATNAGQFLDGVQAACGVNVEVITGEREAELIFRGAASDPAWARERLLVMDVGGGSAEWILGQAGKVERLQSLPFGAVRLREKFKDAGFVELAGYLRRELAPVLEPYRQDYRRVIGTGGTVVTLARMSKQEADHATLTLDAIRAVTMELNAMTLEERREVPGLPPERADIIVAGSAVFLFALELLGAHELTVSVRSLRYGALIV